MREDILELIEKVYKRKFIGRFEIIKRDGGWTVKFYLRPEKPTCISADIPDWNCFLLFMELELRFASYHFVKHFEGYKTYPDCV